MGEPKRTQLLDGFRGLAERDPRSADASPSVEGQIEPPLGHQQEASLMRRLHCGLSQLNAFRCKTLVFLGLAHGVTLPMFSPP